MVEVREEVRKRPDAVFVRAYPYRTFRRIKEDDGFYRAGREIIADLLVPSRHQPREILLKPNIVSGRPRELTRNRNYHGGIVTNPRFIAGMIDSLFELGSSNVTVVEGGVGQGVSGYLENGYIEMMTERLSNGHYPCTREERGARLSWTSKYRFSDYRRDELTWVPVPNGVVHRELPVVAPFRKPGTAFINVPTLKTHNLGITTLCCKGLQGVVANGFRHFCAPLPHFDNAAARCPEILAHLQPDFRERIQAEYARHLAQGLPFWDHHPDPVYGVGRFEPWAQRIGDVLAAFWPFPKHFLLNVVEGIIGRDGTAFHQGHDVPVGLVVAGINPVHVDAVASYLIGHDPRYVPALVVAYDRGLGENNIDRIEILALPDERPLGRQDLDRLRVPLPVYLAGNAAEPLLLNDAFLAQREARKVK